MRLRISLGLSLVGAMLLPDAAHAQVVPAAMPAPSEAVRVSWTDAGHRPVRREGVVVEAGADVIRLQTSDGMETIPATAVTDVEYGHSRTSWEGFKRGFTIGATVGGLGGIVAGAATGAACRGDSFCPGAAGGAAIMGVMFGLGGGIVGGLIKAANPGIEWRDTPVRATAAPAPGGGTTVGLRVSF